MVCLLQSIGNGFYLEGHPVHEVAEITLFALAFGQNTGFRTRSIKEIVPP